MLSFEYRADGLLDSVSLTVPGDPAASRLVSFGYASGELTTIADVGTRESTFNYRPGHLLATVTGPSGSTLRNFYDAAGRVVKQQGPMDYTMEFGYSGTGPNLQARITETMGIVGVHAYAGNMIDKVTENVTHQPAEWKYSYQPGTTWVSAVKDPLNHSWSSTWDARGNLLTSSDPSSRTTTYQYNLTNDLTTITNPAGFTTTVEYYPDGRLRTTTYYYTKNNQVRQVKRADDKLESYLHDGYGRVISQANPLGETTRYQYDDANRQWHVQDPLLRVTQYRYDPAGRLKAVQDAEGFLINFAYYDDDQLKLIDYTNPNKPTPDVALTYNSRGMRETMADGSGVTSYHYDSLGRLDWMKIAPGGGAAERRVDYGHDDAGNITKITYPANSDSARRWVDREFDNLGRLWKVHDFDGLVAPTEFHYDEYSNLKDIIYPNGVQSLYGYDAANRVLTMTHRLNNSTLFELNYVRRGNGLLESSVQKGSGRPDESHSYVYDELSRLYSDRHKIAESSVTLFDLDAASRVLTSTLVPPLGPATTTSYDYDDASQLLSFVRKQGLVTERSLTFAYDAKGNRTRQYGDVVNSQPAPNNYSYDQANRLVLYDGYQKGVPGWGQYTYNGDGLRMSKLSSASTSSTPQAFTWDIAQGLPLLLQEADTNYIYGPGGMLLAQATFGPLGPQGAEEAGKPAKDPSPATEAPEAANVIGGRLYYHADQLGSIIMLTDKAGTVYDRYSYDAYGNRQCDLSLCNVASNPFGYAGPYTDVESGLVYMRARYYDPQTQQFISRDPLVGVTGQAYVYAGGNPVNATDPTGAFPDWPLDAAFIALDILDIQQNGLNWGNGTVLAVDVVLGVTPLVPAVAGWVRRGGTVLTHADEVAGIGNAERSYLYAFGNTSHPRPARPGKDVRPDENGIISPGELPLPHGASTFNNPALAPLTGHYHRIPADTPMPEGLAVVADGSDILARSPNPVGHHTIYNTRHMSVEEFNQLFLGLPWEYGGKK